MAIPAVFSTHQFGCHQHPIPASDCYPQTFATHILHKISAGFPSPAADYTAEPLDLNKYLVDRRTSTFFFTVAGDSMKNASVLDGDKVAVDRAIEPRAGMMVVAVVNGDFTLKWLRCVRGAYELHPDNPDYSPIRFGEGEELQVFGVVTGVVRRLGGL